MSENPYSDNHHVMCDGPQDDLAALAPIPPRTQRRAEPPLDHRVDRLHLPPLAVLALVPREPLLHPPPPLARGGLSDGRPRVGGMIVRMPWDRTPAWTHSASKSASASSVLDPGPAGRLPQRRAELHQVRARAPAGHRRQDQVALASR